VVKRGSFSASADALSSTHRPARSDARSGRCRGDFVVRDRRGVRPTAAGATLGRATPTDLRSDRSGRGDSAPSSRAGLHAAGGIVPVRRRDADPLASRVQARSPLCRLRSPRVSPDIAPRLRAVEFDLALLCDFRVRERLQVSPHRTLLEDPIAVALPFDQPARVEAGAMLPDLLGEDLVQTSRRAAPGTFVSLCIAAVRAETWTSRA